MGWLKVLRAGRMGSGFPFPVVNKKGGGAVWAWLGAMATMGSGVPLAVVNKNGVGGWFGAA